MSVPESSFPAEEFATDRAVKFMLWATFGMITVQVILMIAAQVHLFGDGSAYLYWLLGNRRALEIAFSRNFASIVTQLPVVVALRAGVTDIGIASSLLGAGLYLPLIASLGLCIWIARERPELVLFPLLSATTVTSNTDFFIISESNVLVVLFWPLLFLLTLGREWSRGTFTLACVLAAPTLLCYESMVFFGPILLGLAVWRAREMHRTGDRAGTLGFLGLAVYFAAGIAIAARSIINPRDERNLQLFLDSTQFYRDAQGHLHWLGILSFAALGVIAAALLVRRWPALVGRAIIVAFVVGCAVAAIAPALWPSSFAPILHSRARVLNAYLPPLPGVAFLVAWRRPPPMRRWKYAFIVVAVLAAAQLTWHALATRIWANYLDVFRAEVASQRGLVPYEASVLSREYVDGHPVAVMNTSWTMPTMSILMSPGGRVQAMIRSPLPQEWQPFYPERIDRLPDLSRYGITFDEYIAAVRVTQGQSAH
jgi:hypothetical protein